MSRVIGIVLMVIGVILLVVGVTGAGQLIPFQLTGDLTDNFDDGNISSQWTVRTGGNPDPHDQEVVEESGVLTCRVPTGRSGAGLYTSSRYSFISGGTVSIEVVGQETESAVLAVGAQADPDYFSYRVIAVRSLSMTLAKVWGDGDGTEYEVGNRGGRASSLGLEIDGSIIKFLADGAVFATTSLDHTDLYAHFWAFSSTSYNGETSFDNFAMSTGEGPPPDTGTLTVRCYVDGVLTEPELSQITISPDVGTVYTTSTGIWSGTVTSGVTYTASASYDGVSKSGSAVVPDGGSATIELSWGISPPPDWMEMLKDPMVRAMLSMTGAGMFGVGLVVTVKSKRQRDYYSV